MASRKDAPPTEPFINIKPKALVDYDGVFTVDFTGTEEISWIHFTEWTCMLPSRVCEITFTRRINEHLCNMMHHFDRPPSVKLASLRNPEQKIILVFGHDTEDNAFNMFYKYIDVRNTVLSFLKETKMPVDDIRVTVRLTGTSQTARQQDQGNRCLFDRTPDDPEDDKSETKWFCMADTSNLDVDNDSSNSQFSRLNKNIRSAFGACLRRVSTDSVILTFHHRSTEDALEMISKHEEVRAMILECLQGIDSTVKDIQMEVQLQDFIDPRSLPGHGVLDKRYVDKQEHDKVVQDLSEQVATLKQQLQEMQEKERVQLAVTATDTKTDVGDDEVQDATDLSEPGVSHWKKKDASKPQPMSETVTDLRRQLADTRQELKATTERMHRLEIAQRKATRRDARADKNLRDACWKGNLAEVKRILDTGRADVNCRDAVERTPVMLAARIRHSDMVKLLVSRGADVTLVDVLGENILHWASWGGGRKTVEFVLSLDRVDVNARNIVGQTAAVVARDSGHGHLFHLLVSRVTQ